ncbi:MAG: hypothetical protein IJ593_04710 [Lachnospiraceae bacterium]|nr:hypothetical protein [Lachnospiraceae bacterium]
MVDAICLEKIRNKNGTIIAYKIMSNTDVRVVNAKEIKDAIRNNKINIINLRLTSDNRLVDKGNSDDTILKISDNVNFSGGTPGTGKKFLALRKRDGRTGVAKFSVSLDGCDNINEILCYELGKLLNVDVCEASKEVYNHSNGWIISLFNYDWINDKLETGESLFGNGRQFIKSFNIKNLASRVSDDAVVSFIKMVIFDTITLQEDRHINNFGFIGNKMYSLFDNGRCLMWDQSDEYIIEQLRNGLISLTITNEHGYGFSYLDDIGYDKCRKLVTNNLKYDDFYRIVSKYYKTDRAKLLSTIMFGLYKLILRY